ncbi:MAG: PilT/PilU family type 4a pilus ATPase [Pseudomonadales bacterium]
MDFTKYLLLIIERKASDLFLVVGAKPSIKVSGRLVAIDETPLSESDVQALVDSAMNSRQLKEFSTQQECNFAVGAPGLGRFRVSAYYQRGTPAMVIRRIHTEIPSIEALQLPSIVRELSMTKRGMILFVGATGTGKTTSLASVIDYRNSHSDGHIITVEDPIEFIHEHKKSIITQREVSIDTESFEMALHNSLRQSPDVILMGEIRNQELMRYGLTFAETGHLCLATLHANNADQALDRILNMFPPEHHEKLRMELANNLRAIVAQQLVPSVDGKGRVVATEVLVNTPLVSDLIRRGRLEEIKDVMKRSGNVGMCTFDQALFELYTQDKINYEQTLIHADSANDLRLMIKLSAEAVAKTNYRDSSLSLQDEFDT